MNELDIGYSPLRGKWEITSNGVHIVESFPTRRDAVEYLAEFKATLASCTCHGPIEHRDFCFGKAVTK